VKDFEDIRRKLSVWLLNIENSQNNRQLRSAKEDMNEQLERFDKTWTKYEKNYVLELMVIENDSRRIVREATEIETKLKECDEGD